LADSGIGQIFACNVKCLCSCPTPRVRADEVMLVAAEGILARDVALVATAIDAGTRAWETTPMAIGRAKVPDVPPRFARINVVGTSGSGKSTFSRRIAAILGAPYIEMDRLHWRSNWQAASDPEFLGALRDALSAPAWVLDGNYYTRTTSIKWAAVDAVIWLDLSFAVTLWQVVARTLRRSLRGNELWPGTGNRESIGRNFFSRDSIVLWMIRTHAQFRRRYQAAIADPQHAHIAFIRLRSRRQMATFLDRLARRPAEGNPRDGAATAAAPAGGSGRSGP
jgi:adenylate kinase family enzyme